MSRETKKFCVQVAVNGVPKDLFYELPEQFTSATPGFEVTVEVGKRKAAGWVTAKLDVETATGKRLEEQALEDPGKQLSFFHGASQQFTPKFKPVLAARKVFQEADMQLFRWMAEYYGSSLGDAIDTAVPRRTEDLKVRCFVPGTKALKSALDELQRRAPLQATVLTYVLEAASPVAASTLKTLGPSASAAVRTLLNKKLLREVLVDDSAASSGEDEGSEKTIFPASEPEVLTDGQQRAVAHIGQALGDGGFNPFLLYGVTGSGKTEIYIRAVQQVLAGGGSALVIVPEIALTPQFLDQLRLRLKVPLALLHSQLGQRIRWQAWQAALDGKARVAIGARSAVFAPLHDLRLIVVDEEHESSYKQSDSLRYNARDVAVMRAKLARAVVVLGSATPSFESLVNVREKRYRMLELPKRATTRPLPTIELVDLMSIKKSEMPSPNISPQLHQALQETLDARGQAVILFNHRGFASYLQCETCGQAVVCPNCSVSFTLHKKKNRLVCHYCNLSLIPPSYCMYCRDPKTTRIEAESGAGKKTATGLLAERGAGTEKIVEELQTLFPQASILRMDRDTVTRKGAYRSILGSMRGGDADILVGTQMIAKGHDLPGVVLVGIVNADVALHLPDFRASEKAFQLITQAAGRAGRGEEPGRVFLQTREAKHPTIVACITGRFKAFARYELDYRKKLYYPPEGRLVRLIISSSDRRESFDAAHLVKQAVREFVQNNGKTVVVLGPAPAPYEKLCNRYRWHILIKAESSKLLSELAGRLNQWKATVAGFKDFRLAVDVDPTEML